MLRRLVALLCAGVEVVLVPAAPARPGRERRDRGRDGLGRPTWRRRWAGLPAPGRPCGACARGRRAGRRRRCGLRVDHELAGPVPRAGARPRGGSGVCGGRAPLVRTLMRRLASPLAGPAHPVYADRARSAVGDGPVDEGPEATRAELVRQGDAGSFEGGSQGMRKVRPGERDRDDPEQGQDRRQEPEGEPSLSRARLPPTPGGGGRAGLVRRPGHPSSQLGHGDEMGGLDIRCRLLGGSGRQLPESIAELGVCVAQVFLVGSRPTGICVVQRASPSSSFAQQRRAKCSGRVGRSRGARIELPAICGPRTTPASCA